VFYLDTSVFIALIEKRHPNHGYAVGFANTALYRGEKLFISTHVLSEALLSEREYRRKYPRISSYLVLIKTWPRSLELRAKAIARRRKIDYDDVLHVLIAKENHIGIIASFDKDFKNVVEIARLQYFNPRYYRRW